jgi:hypothetical protein
VKVRRGRQRQERVDKKGQKESLWWRSMDCITRKGEKVKEVSTGKIKL